MASVWVDDGRLGGIVDVGDVTSISAYGELEAKVRQQLYELLKRQVDAISRAADAHVAHPIDFLAAFALAPLRIADVDLRASRVLN